MTLRKIKLGDREVRYRIRKSGRARRLRVSVNCDEGVVVTLPGGLRGMVSESFVDKFLKQNAKWLLDKIDYFNKMGESALPVLSAKKSREDYLKNKEKVLGFVKQKLENFNKFYGFSYNKILIKNQKTRWGSCSNKGNLNFNYKIIHLPEYLADYIIVHELCHLGELNHSPRFWNLVARAMPEHKEARRELKRMRIM